jgi:hypothetical protein
VVVFVIIEFLLIIIPRRHQQRRPVVFAGHLHSPVQSAHDAGRNRSGQPSGPPTATTGWPTFTDDEDPSAMTLTSWEVCTFSTARSVCGSRPVIVAGAVRRR